MSLPPQNLTANLFLLFLDNRLFLALFCFFIVFFHICYLSFEFFRFFFINKNFCFLIRLFLLFFVFLLFLCHYEKLIRIFFPAVVLAKAGVLRLIRRDYVFSADGFRPLPIVFRTFPRTVRVFVFVFWPRTGSPLACRLPL